MQSATRMNSTRRVILIASLASLSTFFAFRARADIPSPQQEACAQKSPGESCKVDDKAGNCTTSTCSRATPTGTTKYDCVVCITDKSDAAIPADATTGDDALGTPDTGIATGGNTGTGGNTAPAVDAGAHTGGTAGTGANTGGTSGSGVDAGTKPSPGSNDDDSGCQMGRGPHDASAFAPWLLGGLFALVVSRAGRRVRR